MPSDRRKIFINNQKKKILSNNSDRSAQSLHWLYDRHPANLNEMIIDRMLVKVQGSERLR